MAREKLDRRNEMLRVLSDVRYLSFRQFREYLFDRNQGLTGNVLSRWKTRGYVESMRLTVDGVRALGVYWLSERGREKAAGLLGVEPEAIPGKVRPSNIKHQLDVAELYLELYRAGTIRERKRLRQRVDFRDSSRSRIEFEYRIKDRRLSPDAVFDSPEKGNTIYVEVDRSNRRIRTLRSRFDRYSRFFKYGFVQRHPGRRPVLVYVATDERRERTVNQIWEEGGRERYLPLAVFRDPYRAAAAMRAWLFTDSSDLPAPPPDREDVRWALCNIRYWIVASARSMKEDGTRVRGGPEIEAMKDSLRVLELLIEGRLG